MKLHIYHYYQKFYSLEVNYKSDINYKSPQKLDLEDIPGLLKNYSQISNTLGELQNIYDINGVIWQKHSKYGWLCVDDLLDEDFIISIRDFRDVKTEKYKYIQKLLSLC